MGRTSNRDGRWYSIGVGVVGLAFAATSPDALGRQECGRWAPAPVLTGSNGQDGAQVHASTLWDPDGDGPAAAMLVVGGALATAGGVLCNNVAAWDGAAWHPMGSGVAGFIETLHVHDGELYAGGYFGRAGTPNDRGVLRWTGAAWEPVGTLAQGVQTILTYQGEMYAGGSFGSSPNDSVRFVARWNGAEWVSVGAGLPSNFVFAMTVHAGELVACSYFDIYAWNGSAWRTLPSSGAGLVGYRSLHSHQGQLFAGCTAAGGTSNLRRFNGTSWFGVTSSSFSLSVTTQATFGSDLVFGGSLTSPLRQGTYLYRWDGSQVRDFAQSPSYFVETLLADADRLFVGGSFARVGSQLVRGVAEWNGTSWSALGSGVGGGRVRALGEWDGTVYIGGSISDETGDPAVMMQVGDELRSIGHVGNAQSVVAAFRVYNGRMVIGGSFRTMDGVVVNGIVAHDGDVFELLGDGVPFPTGATRGYVGVRALEVWNTDLIAGGVMRDGHLRRWNGSAWSNLSVTPLSAPQPFTAEVNSMTTLGGELIVGGWFDRAGAVPLANIARWDGAQWRAMGTGLGDPQLTSEQVESVVVGPDGLYAAGRFERAGNVLVRNVARWDGAAWRSVGEGFDAGVHALALVDGQVWAGGDFSRSGETVLDGLARWDGKAWRPVGGGVYAGSSGEVRALLSRSRDVLIGGAFGRVAGIDANMLARWQKVGPDTNGDGTVNSADFFAFLVDFFGGTPVADYNADGTVTSADFFAFLAAFFSGC
jgi:hypothetical protein